MRVLLRVAAALLIAIPACFALVIIFALALRRRASLDEGCSDQGSHLIAAGHPPRQKHADAKQAA